MFELNDQELEQVVGGSGLHYGSASAAGGIGTADLGIIATHSSSFSQVTPNGAISHAWNDTLAIGVNTAAASTSNTAAGASY
jgi:hypothetical protein